MQVRHWFTSTPDPLSIVWFRGGQGPEKLIQTLIFRRATLGLPDFGQGKPYPYDVRLNKIERKMYPVRPQTIVGERI